MARRCLTAIFVSAFLFSFQASGNVRAEAAWGTDIIGETAITSFAAMLEVLPAAPVLDSSAGVWTLQAPDGGAQFSWRSDASDSRAYDAYLTFDSKNFLDAGLDAGKLPDGLLSGDKITIGIKLSDSPLAYESDVTPLSSFEQIVKLDRKSVGYHAALDHYGVTVSEGTMFEWAKDLTNNDKDIVFVLNPEPFIAAGVNPAAIDGWAFAQVTVDDENGKPVVVDKILKPFDLR